MHSGKETFGRVRGTVGDRATTEHLIRLTDWQYDVIGAPSSSTSRSSTPKTPCPCLALTFICSPRGKPRNFGLRLLMTPSGVVSVMPQRCLIGRLKRSRRRCDVIYFLPTTAKNAPCWSAPALRETVFAESAMIGLIVLCLGLSSLLLSGISVAYGWGGLGDLTTLAGIVVGLVSIAVGSCIYKRWRRRFITKREVAKLFGVSERTVEHWLRDGKLPKPKRKLGLRRWNYYELIALRKFKQNS